MGAVPDTKKMVDVLKENIGGRVVDILLNFIGSYPPERRSFQGVVTEVGGDYFILHLGATKSDLVARFENLAYVIVLPEGAEAGSIFERSL